MLYPPPKPKQPVEEIMTVTASPIAMWAAQERGVAELSGFASDELLSVGQFMVVIRVTFRGSLCELFLRLLRKQFALASYYLYRVNLGGSCG